MWVGGNAIYLDVEGVSTISLVSVSAPHEFDVSSARFVPTQDGVYLLFLLPGIEYTLDLEPGGKRVVVQPNPPTGGLGKCFSFELFFNYIDGNYPDSVIQQVMMHSSSNYLFTRDRSVELWARLFRHGLFALDSDCGFVAIPNPKNRFCFDLTPESVRKWNIKERFLDDFEFVVSTDSEKLRSSLSTCRQMHSSGNWITPRFMDNVTEMMCRREFGIDFFVFELIEKSSKKIGSISIGYRFGTSFTDFTACTPIRDKRSVGKLLLKAEHDYLRSLGVKLWYLGLELPYMKALGGGSVILDRRQFHTKW